MWSGPWPGAYDVRYDAGAWGGKWVCNSASYAACGTFISCWYISWPDCMVPGQQPWWGGHVIWSWIGGFGVRSDAVTGC